MKNPEMEPENPIEEAPDKVFFHKYVISFFTLKSE